MFKRQSHPRFSASGGKAPRRQQFYLFFSDGPGLMTTEGRREVRTAPEETSRRTGRQRSSKFGSLPCRAMVNIFATCMPTASSRSFTSPEPSEELLQEIKLGCQQVLRLLITRVAAHPESAHTPIHWGVRLDWRTTISEEKLEFLCYGSEPQLVDEDGTVRREEMPVDLKVDCWD